MSGTSEEYWITSLKCPLFPSCDRRVHLWPQTPACHTTCSGSQHRVKMKIVIALQKFCCCCLETQSCYDFYPGFWVHNLPALVAKSWNTGVCHQIWLLADNLRASLLFLHVSLRSAHIGVASLAGVLKTDTIKPQFSNAETHGQSAWGYMTRVLSLKPHIYINSLLSQGIVSKMGKKECESQGLGKSCEMLSSGQDTDSALMSSLKKWPLVTIRLTAPGNIVAGNPRLSKLQQRGEGRNMRWRQAEGCLGG